METELQSLPCRGAGTVEGSGHTNPSYEEGGHYGKKAECLSKQQLCRRENNKE